MLASKCFLSTLKEVQSTIESISHKLMIRSGMIRRSSSGLYIWMPIGLKVIKKIIKIIRKEMIKIGFVEILTPIMQPSSIWKKTGRYYKYGEELIKLTDRNNKIFVLSPTDEEIITLVISKTINSYKELPLCLFQIKTKFRDEMRPRFGVVRSKEFIMKDAYSFHEDEISFSKTYNKVQTAYCNSFKNMNLKFYIIPANTGAIGGHASHEFHALSKFGESKIALSSTKDHAYNIDFINQNVMKNVIQKPIQELQLVDGEFIKKIKKDNIVKTILVKANKTCRNTFVALLIRSDHILSFTKIEKLNMVKRPLSFANSQDIYKHTGIKSYLYTGPIGLTVPIIADKAVAVMRNFVAGANIYGKYYTGINWNRDLPLPHIADICLVRQGDTCSNSNAFHIKRSIEIGHIFQLGTKYSNLIKANIKNREGSNQPIIMGCYGIGVTRTVAAIIEQHHDEHGIIWPENIAPFNVAIVPINMYFSSSTKNTAEQIYHQLLDHGVEVILDDRKQWIGSMIYDMELIGIPHILIIGKRYLSKKIVTYKNRRLGLLKHVHTKHVVDFVLSQIDN